MKVRQLIEALKELDGDRLVVMSRDEEGNGFAPLMGIEANAMYANGDTGFEALTPELIQQGYGDEDVMENGEKCVVLWP